MYCKCTQKLSCCQSLLTLNLDSQEVAIDKMIVAVFLLSTGIRNYNYDDPVTQTYRFECRGGEGDTILIEDTDAGNVGHRISEVKVYEKLVLGKLM